MPSSVPTSAPARASLRLTVLLVISFAAYYAAGRIGLAAPFTSFNVSPVWPAAGVAPVLLYFFGFRLWPAIAAAAFAVNFGTGISTFAAVAIAFGNSASAVVGAGLLRRYLSPDAPLHRVRDVGLFISVVTALAPAVAATVGVSALVATGADPWSGFGSAWLVWWLGDAMGLLLLAPVLLSLRAVSPPPRPLLLNVAFAALSAYLVFDGQLFRQDVLAFLLFPFVVWGALRFSVAGSAITCLAIATIAVWQTAQGDGPFAHHDVLLNVAFLQVFLAVISMTGLFLGAAVGERGRAEDLLEREQALRRADARAAEIESRFRAVAETSAIAIYIHDGKRLLYINPAIETISGYGREEILAMDMWSLVHPECRAQMQAYVAARFRGDPAPHRYEFKLITRSGEERWVDFTGSVVQFEGRPCVLATALDVTERKRAEEALRVSERLATAGRMAAAIAHEINNPLEAMSNLIYLIDASPGLSPEVRGYVEKAQQSLQRVSQVARQTLSFYRDSTAPVAVRLDALADAVVDFYQQQISAAGVTINRSADHVPAVVAYPGELRQLLSNLLVNSLDAVGKGGNICIRFTAIGNSDGWQGVRIFFADDGPGIPHDLRARVFEPFFTTKGHKGTGLGLWVARGVVQKQGGRMRLRSGFLPGGRGTAFAVYLPAAPAALAAAAGLALKKGEQI